MKTISNIVFPFMVAGMFLLFFLPFIVFLTQHNQNKDNQKEDNQQKEEACEIKKTLVWCFEHQKQEELWEIQGRQYLIKRSYTSGYPEITGLYSRTHREVVP